MNSVETGRRASEPDVKGIDRSHLTAIELALDCLIAECREASPFTAYLLGIARANLAAERLQGFASSAQDARRLNSD